MRETVFIGNPESIMVKEQCHSQWHMMQYQGTCNETFRDDLVA